PLTDRRLLLDAVLRPTAVIRMSEAVAEHGVAFYRAAQELGVEGIMAKRRDAPYRPGERAKSWLKIKVTQRMEAVVGGFTRGRGARANTFGAVLLGVYDGGGRLQSIGHCGGGSAAAARRRGRPSLRVRGRRAGSPRTRSPAHRPASSSPTWKKPSGRSAGTPKGT